MEKPSLIKKDNTYYLPVGKPDQPLRLIQLPKEEISLVKKLYGLPGDVNPAFVISLGGKPYIVHQGLIDLAHKRKLKKIISKEVKVVRCAERGCVRQIQRGYRDNQGNVYKSSSDVPAELWKQRKVYKNMAELSPSENEYCFVYGTTVVMADGSRYYAEADACPHNTTSTVRGSLARMAQTRSTNIALSRILNVPLTSAEELPGVNVDFETGEVKEVDSKKDTKEILKEINALRENLSMERKELAQLASKKYKKDPYSLSAEELSDFKDMLEEKVKVEKEKYEKEKAEGEEIQEDFLAQEEINGEG